MIAEFKRKYLKNKRLSLLDMNEYIPLGILHSKFLRITAAVLGILFGIGFVSSTLTEPPERDEPRPANSSIPAAPLDGWRIVDKAEVFGEDGTAGGSLTRRRCSARTARRNLRRQSGISKRRPAAR